MYVYIYIQSIRAAAAAAAAAIILVSHIFAKNFANDKRSKALSPFCRAILLRKNAAIYHNRACDDGMNISRGVYR